MSFLHSKYLTLFYHTLVEIIALLVLSVAIREDKSRIKKTLAFKLSNSFILNTFI